jgi:hypothetical protein
LLRMSIEEGKDISLEVNGPMNLVSIWHPCDRILLIDNGAHAPPRSDQADDKGLRLRFAGQAR